MELSFELDTIKPKQGFFQTGSCFALHVNTPKQLSSLDTTVESFESPLFIIHQLTCASIIQAYVIEPFYRYVEYYHNVIVMRRIKSIKNVTAKVKVTHSLGPLSVVADEDNSMAIFCVDTSSRPIT